MSAEVERNDWLSYPTENFTERKQRRTTTGANRGICQTTRRCFYPTIEVLNGLGKGMLKEAFQVCMQELNESELSDEVSKGVRQCQKPGGPSLSRDEYRGYLREKLPVLALGIKAAGIVYRLDYGTVEATRW
jgi:hypothetical protein